MRKVVAALFVGLLWSSILTQSAYSKKVGSSAEQDALINSGQIYLGISYRAFGKVAGNTSWGIQIYTSSENIQVSVQDTNIYVFKKNQKEKWHKAGFTSNDPKLIGIFNNQDIQKNWRDAKDLVKKNEGSISWHHKNAKHARKAIINLDNSVFGKKIIVKNKNKMNVSKEYSEEYSTTQSAGISFTIKDKKEDCKAIGFKPNTEKFADCVLKLVELDVKRKVNDPSMASQSQANQQVANELKRQNNLRQSQFLMNLSQQLLTPSSPASNMTTCRWSGQFLNCW